jgi:hypothetical protein
MEDKCCVLPDDHQAFIMQDCLLHRLIINKDGILLREVFDSPGASFPNEERVSPGNMQISLYDDVVGCFAANSDDWPVQLKCLACQGAGQKGD